MTTSSWSCGPRMFRSLNTPRASIATNWRLCWILDTKSSTKCCCTIRVHRRSWSVGWKTPSSSWRIWWAGWVTTCCSWIVMMKPTQWTTRSMCMSRCLSSVIWAKMTVYRRSRNDSKYVVHSTTSKIMSTCWRTNWNWLKRNTKSSSRSRGVEWSEKLSPPVRIMISCTIQPNLQLMIRPRRSRIRRWRWMNRSFNKWRRVYENWRRIRCWDVEEEPNLHGEGWEDPGDQGEGDREPRVWW